MKNKLHETLDKSIKTLKEVKEKLEKDFSSFGSVIGGGTTEKPTIAATPATSLNMNDANGKDGDWLEQSKKEKIDFFKNGQWNLKDFDKCSNKEA